MRVRAQINLKSYKRDNNATNNLFLTTQTVTNSDHIKIYLAAILCNSQNQLASYLLTVM